MRCVEIHIPPLIIGVFFLSLTKQFLLKWIYVPGFTEYPVYLVLQGELQPLDGRVLVTLGISPLVPSHTPQLYSIYKFR